MEVVDIELVHRLIGDVLVVLFQNLVQTQIVQVDIPAQFIVWELATAFAL